MEDFIALENIYDAAFDDDAFRELSSQLACTFGARSALLHWIHKDGTTDILSHSGYFSQQQLDSYARTFVAMDPWVHATAGPGLANQVHDLEKRVPVERFLQSDFYNEYIQAIGDDTCRCLGVRLESEWGSGFIALQRGLKQPSFDTQAVRALQKNFHHLARMLAIRGRIAVERHHARTIAAAIDALAQPMLIIDREMRIKHLNHAAEQLLDKGDVLRLHAGALAAVNNSGDRELRRAVRGALSERDSGAAAVAVPDPGGGQLCLSAVATSVAGARLALLMAGSTSQGVASRERRLRELYGLSAAEAALAVLLADGLSVTEIAERRGVAVDTVRAQLKQISWKMRCSRQSEIVRVVAELPALQAASEV